MNVCWSWSCCLIPVCRCQHVAEEIPCWGNHLIAWYRCCLIYCRHPTLWKKMYKILVLYTAISFMQLPPYVEVGHYLPSNSLLITNCLDQVLGVYPILPNLTQSIYQQRWNRWTKPRLRRRNKCGFKCKQKEGLHKWNQCAYHDDSFVTRITT